MAYFTTTGGRVSQVVDMAYFTTTGGRVLQVVPAPTRRYCTARRRRLPAKPPAPDTYLTFLSGSSTPRSWWMITVRMGDMFYVFQEFSIRRVRGVMLNPLSVKYRPIINTVNLAASTLPRIWPMVNCICYWKFAKGKVKECSRKLDNSKPGRYSKQGPSLPSLPSGINFWYIYIFGK